MCVCMCCLCGALWELAVTMSVAIVHGAFLCSREPIDPPLSPSGAGAALASCQLVHPGIGRVHSCNILPHGTGVPHASQYCPARPSGFFISHLRPKLFSTDPSRTPQVWVILPGQATPKGPQDLQVATPTDHRNIFIPS